KMKLFIVGIFVLNMKIDKGIKAGDEVEIHFIKEIYEGTLLESSESDKNIVLLKLGNGYNIGFPRKEILEIKLVEKAREVEDKVELKKSSGKPNIAMVITGGTIAARLNPKKGGVDWLDTPESLFKYYPGIFDKVNVLRLERPFMKASEDMDYKDWQKIAKVVSELLNDTNIQGVIITHGTDFLGYTSAALSFFLGKLNKPVVLTYSQRSIDRASSDANLNLICAAVAATSEIAEVMLVGHANESDEFCYAMPGAKVRKLHTSRRDAFKVVNGRPFAKVTQDGIEIMSDFNRRNNSKVKVDNKFEEKVALLKIYPGQEANVLDYYVKNGYKGLVLEMSGLGHAPTSRARHGWTKKLKEVQKKIAVCATSQCINGRVDPLVYSNGRELLETGIIYLEDMLSETALVKLSYVLGKTTNKEEVKKLMLTNMVGELNDMLE
ncbi:MAG: Glu-tRNA(Gln) amidotransferase subunit GatD, partial [Nanoarchaeota archaeon]